MTRPVTPTPPAAHTAGRAGGGVVTRPATSTNTNNNNKETHMKRTCESVQQGDVVLSPITRPPAGAVPVPAQPLAVGEGHHHHVMVGDVSYLTADEEAGVEALFVTVGQGGATLEHHVIGGGPGEHATITVSPGTYRVHRVHEWDLTGPREVQD
jgi:hypothetical protein